MAMRKLELYREKRIGRAKILRLESLTRKVIPNANLGRIKN